VNGIIWFSEGNRVHPAKAQFKNNLLR